MSGRVCVCVCVCLSQPILIKGKTHRNVAACLSVFDVCAVCIELSSEWTQILSLSVTHDDSTQGYYFIFRVKIRTMTG